MVCAVSSTYLTIDFFFSLRGHFVETILNGKNCDILLCCIKDSILFAFKIVFSNKSKVNVHYK